MLCKPIALSGSHSNTMFQDSATSDWAAEMEVVPPSIYQVFKE